MARIKITNDKQITNVNNKTNALRKMKPERKTYIIARTPRKAMSKEKRAAVRARDSLRKRMRRAALSLEELMELRQKEALDKKKYREKLTEERLLELRSKDAERKRLERSSNGIRKTKESYITKRKPNKRKVAEKASTAAINKRNTGTRKSTAKPIIKKKPAKKVKFS